MIGTAFCDSINPVVNVAILKVDQTGKLLFQAGLIPLLTLMVRHLQSKVLLIMVL
ncbi:MAG: hypothetical protein R2942_02125 [Ignavibacteria bacterium]